MNNKKIYFLTKIIKNLYKYKMLFRNLTLSKINFNYL